MTLRPMTTNVNFHVFMKYANWRMRWCIQSFLKHSCKVITKIAKCSNTYIHTCIKRLRLRDHSGKFKINLELIHSDCHIAYIQGVSNYMRPNSQSHCSFENEISLTCNKFHSAQYFECEITRKNGDWIELFFLQLLVWKKN